MPDTPPPFDPKLPFRSEDAPAFDPSKPFTNVGGGERGVWDMLTGETGPRYQLWPERLARGAIGALSEGPKLMRDVAEGRVDPTSEEGVGRAFEAAAAVSPAAPARAGIATAARETIPTATQLLKHSTAGYEALKDSGTTFTNAAATGVHNAVKLALEGEHYFGDINAPQTFKMLGRMQRAKDDEQLTMGEMIKIRESLRRVGGDPQDQAAAAYASQLIDKYLTQVPAEHIASGDPIKDAEILRQASSSYRGAKRSEALIGDKAGSGGVIERGERQMAKSGTGWNLNTIRQRIDAILNSPEERARYDSEELEALREIVIGTTPQNLARQAGKLAPTGVVSALPTLGAALSGQNIAAGAIAGLGFGGHFLENAITRRALNKVAEDIRRKTPLYRSSPGRVVQPSASAGVLPPAMAAQAHEAPTDGLEQDDVLAH